MLLKAGMGVFSLLRERLFLKNKKRKVQMKKYRMQKRHQKSQSSFVKKKKKGVFRWTKVGFKAGLIVKERYF
jgi:hypothetical protein